MQVIDGICEGLDCLHSQGLVHLDVKPQDGGMTLPRGVDGLRGLVLFDASSACEAGKRLTT